MTNPYDYIAEQWHSHNRSFRERHYVDMVLKDLPPGAKVLDLGCGTGKPIARYLLDRGFRIVGVDQSEKMLEIARQEVPEAILVHTDLLHVELSDKFAAAIAWDSIFHIARGHHPAVFRRLHEMLQPDGRLLLSAGGSGTDGCTSEMFGHTFFYSGYEPEVTLDLLKAEGFMIDFWEVDDPSSRGHIAIVARKDASGVSSNCAGERTKAECH